jgi:hypothetical protein
MIMMEEKEKKINRRRRRWRKKERKREHLITIHCELYKASIPGLTCSLFHI